MGSTDEDVLVLGEDRGTNHQHDMQNSNKKLRLSHVPSTTDVDSLLCKGIPRTNTADAAKTAAPAAMNVGNFSGAPSFPAQDPSVPFFASAGTRGYFHAAMSDSPKYEVKQSLIPTFKPGTTTVYQPPIIAGRAVAADNQSSTDTQIDTSTMMTQDDLFLAAARGELSTPHDDDIPIAHDDIFSSSEEDESEVEQGE